MGVFHMKIAIRVLAVLLCLLLVAGGIAWYMLEHGGQQAGTKVPSADTAPARQLLTDLKAESSLSFSLAIPRDFDWYVASAEENPLRITLSGVAMICSSATGDDAATIDAWLRRKGFQGDAVNSSYGDTTVCEGYVHDSIAVLVETPISSDGSTLQVTKLVVYAGILPEAITSN